jgi:hypothetical protein
MNNALREFLGLPLRTPPHEHEWGPWSIYKETERRMFAPGKTAENSIPLRVDRVITQTRECTSCHFREYDQEVLDQ